MSYHPHALLHTIRLQKREGGNYQESSTCHYETILKLVGNYGLFTRTELENYSFRSASEHSMLSGLGGGDCAPQCPLQSANVRPDEGAGGGMCYIFNTAALNDETVRSKVA